MVMTRHISETAMYKFTASFFCVVPYIMQGVLKIIFSEIREDG